MTKIFSFSILGIKLKFPEGHYSNYWLYFLLHFRFSTTFRICWNRAS